MDNLSCDDGSSAVIHNYSFDISTHCTTLGPGVDTIVFTVVRLVIQNIFGWLKNATRFNMRNTIAFAMIAFFTSVFVVGNTISALPDNLFLFKKLF